MSTAAEHPTRRSQSASTMKYDRIARFYSTLEPLYLIFLRLGARRWPHST